VCVCVCVCVYVSEWVSVCMRRKILWHPGLVFVCVHMYVCVRVFVSWVLLEYKACLIEYRALLIEYRALLIV